MSDLPRVCALLPAHNEAERIGVTLAALRARPEIGTIVVVDDGSTDGTADRAREAGATLVLTRKNGGKGAPMSCAMIYWGEDFEKFLTVFSKFGAVIDLRPLKGKKFGECSENGQLDLIEQEG